jgi:lipid A ethanolaminephosphotransferase
MREITSQNLIILVSVFLIVFGNITFFSNTIKVYPPNAENLPFLFSLALLYFSVNVIFFSLICFRFTIKPGLIAVLLVSSITAYFMDTYNIIIDETMLDNAFNTNAAESFDLISPKLFLYLALLGIAPSLLIYRLRITRQRPKQAIIFRTSIIVGALVTAVASVFIFGNFYAPFFREHKQLRFYANPAYYLYSIGKYAGKNTKEANTQLKAIGQDAKTPESDEHRELIILVVGETARADRFSLNGYERTTNPLLEQEDVISFNNTWACGTSTAVSVPCMFSIYDHDHYLNGEANAIENSLDVLQHAGVNVIWLDNNSDSKGVAQRVPFENYRTPDNNPICDTECRDEGMLSNLQSYIDQHPQGDIFIILHQMGNHGPAYYKRYPKEFERFTPTCQTNQLEHCSREEIDNAYDNAILYTDYFLSKTITLLKQNVEQFETAMFYVSDHGESLGENNLYLHGMPYMLAPDAQTHVPMIMWFGQNFDQEEIDLQSLRKQTSNRYTHDNVFHTILGLFELETPIYDEKLDIVEHTDDH